MSRIGSRWIGASMAAGALTLSAVVAGAEHFTHPVQESAYVAATGPSAVIADRQQRTAAQTWRPSGDPCDSGASAEALSQAFRCAATRALPAVVHIQVESVQDGVDADPFRGSPFEDFFRQFPGNRDPEPGDRVVRGSGSGFIFRPDGYVLTNNHVVEGAERVTVISQDREYSAEIVGRDPNTDVAVVKIDAENLPAVELGDSDPVQIGDWVVALGYPLQLGATVTSGIISATSRSIGILQRTEDRPVPLENFLQTDAAINPGNSGGPLVDLRGHVIGMNTAIASPTGFYSGYGFAVPINLAMRVADDLIEYGAVHRPRIGVSIVDPTSADVEVFGLDRARGAAVVQIEAGGPADRAGIELGDVIIAVAGDPVASVAQLQDRIARREPGDRVDIQLIRERGQRTVQVVLGQFETTVVEERRPEPESGSAANVLGFEFAPLTPDLAQRLGLERAAGGVVITSVDRASGAFRAGIQPGLVIERIDGREVEEVDDVAEISEDLRPGAAVSMIVRLPDGSRMLRNFRTRASR